MQAHKTTLRTHQRPGLFHHPVSTLPQKPGVFHYSTVGCFVEACQPQLNTDNLTRRWKFFLRVNVDAKLSVVAIGSPHYPDLLNLRNAVKPWVRSFQPQKGSSLKTVGEGEMLPVL